MSLKHPAIWQVSTEDGKVSLVEAISASEAAEVVFQYWSARAAPGRKCRPIKVEWMGYEIVRVKEGSNEA